MNILEDLFASQARVRLFNLFLKNEEQELTKKEIVQKTNLQEPTVRSELKKLGKMKFLHSRSQKRVNYYSTNTSFIFFRELKEMIEKSGFEPDKKLLSEIKKTGTIQYAILTGHLISPVAQEADADMMVVGKKIDEQKLEKIVQKLEAEVGKDIRYAVMETKEFMYRCEMYDRFTIALLRGPHRELVNTLPRMPKQAVESKGRD